MSGMTEPSGYSHEDAIFKKQDQEMIAKMRAAADAKRQKSASDAEKAAHWMRCPKCGGQMDEKRLETILVDECAGCGGIYFDKDELSILLKHEKASSGILRKLFGA